MKDMMKKDFDLFDAYRNGPRRSGSGSVKPIVITILVLLFVVGSIYAGLQVLGFYTQEKINAVNAEIQSLSDRDSENQLAEKKRYNELLSIYNKEISAAKGNFDKSIIIDSALLKEVSSSMPADFTVTNINITPQTMIISGTCSNFLSPAIFKQSLDGKEIFSSVRYNSVSRGQADDFSFSITCTFKEVDSE